MTATPLTEPARTDLCRSVPFEQIRDEGDPGDGRTFRGYAAVFNQPTVINSWEGRFEEVILPGAFKKTLAERTPAMMYNHGRSGLWEDHPIGKYTDVHEDDHGVFTEGRLHDNWLIQPIRDAVADGSIPGMSFRFSVVQDRWEMDGVPLRSKEQILSAISRTEGPMPRRSVRELKSPEMGPVAHPAYAGTSASVRSVTIDLSKDIGDEDRAALARAVFAADAAARQEDSPESPGDTVEAVVHEDRDTETPQGTETTAAEHESDSGGPRGPRFDLRDWMARKRPRHVDAQERANRYA